MADHQGLERLIRDVEDRVLSAFSTHSFRAAASVSLAHGFLREALNSCAGAAADLQWLAFVIPPFARNNWWVVSAQDGDMAAPLEVLAPEDAAARVAVRCRDLQADVNGVGTGPAATVSLGDLAGWGLADEVGEVVGVYVDVSITPDRPGLEGALLVGLGRPAGGDVITALEDGIEHASGCVRDRLRLAYAREAAPVRVVASLDDAFQEHLGLARQAPGLREFLAHLQHGAGKAAPDEPPPLVAPAEAVTTSAVGLSPNDAMVREVFKKALAVLQPVGEKAVIALRTAQTDDAPLRTPVGNWAGWCEFRWGLGNLRYGTAVLTFAHDTTTLNAELARYAARAKRAHGLVVLVPTSFEPVAQGLLERWQETFNVSCAGFSPSD
jgi:hypothetical protein